MDTASIALIISLTMAVIGIYKFYLERPKLKIYQQLDEPHYYFKATNPKKYTLPYEVLLGVRIDNVSNTPISIAEFQLKIGGHAPVKSTRHSLTNEEYNLLAEIEGIPKPFNQTLKPNQLLPVITLAPYSTVIGIARFPDCPKIEQSFFKTYFSAVSPRGNHNCPVTIHFARNRKDW